MRPEYVEKRKEKMRQRRRNAFDWVESVVTALMFCVLLFTFVMRVVGVDGTSMINTLEHGDRLLISNFLYSPRQGDIVVLRKLSFSSDPIIKRVIATEGQLVSIDFESGTVSVDGEELEEPYVHLEQLPMRALDFQHMMDRDLGGVLVPEGCIFVMGDNRQHSADSRYAPIGLVDERCIVGKVMAVVFPFSQIGWVH